MKHRLSLSVQVYALALLNLLLLLGVLLAIARFAFHVEFRSLLFAPARDRVIATAREASFDLEQVAPDARTELMGRYRASYGADFYLFTNDGTQVAGKPVKLPDEVQAALIHSGPPPERPEPPPPLREFGGEGPPLRRPPPQRSPDDERINIFQLSAGGLFWAGARIPVPNDAGGPPLHGTLLIAAPSFYGTPLFFDFKPWVIALGAAVAVFVLCWLPFIRSLTRTIARITRATEQIAEGKFDHHLPDGRGDELGQLSGAINRMADRLSGFVTGQKRFLGDIAHELCAPIARMQFGLGILERHIDEERRPAWEDVQDEMRQMSSLVNELLSFSKAGMRSDAQPLAVVEVAETVREAVAREAAVDVHVDVDEPLVAIADREYLLRAVSNLVRNAIRYAGAAGPITVTGRRENGDVVVVVADSGAGIPENEIDRVFTPFYRLENSRNRETGGVGLGLAIVRSCVEACHGRVQCRNRKPSGLEVEIRLSAA
jgi:two-component system sensor histidine kinase CpxA